jgi:hypothetical protein
MNEWREQALSQLCAFCSPDRRKESANLCYGDFSPVEQRSGYDLASPLRNMPAKRKWRFVPVVLTVACMVPSISAQIMEAREYHGKQVTCLHSGIYSTAGWVCGTQHHARVFTGTVQSVVEVGDTDKRLELIPDEVFLGDPASEVTAITNQACLHTDIQAGEKWLFYLDRDGKTNELVLGYDGPSRPIEKAQQDISTLRHLSKMTDSGILTGHGGPPGHKVVARRLSDGAEFSALANTNGNYEFELLPGAYHLTANTKQGLWAPETETFVSKQACIHVDLWLHTDGRIAGTVTTAEGKGARYVQVAIVPVSPAGQSFTVVADEQGHFEVGGRKPGQYLVGVGLMAPVDSAEWKSRVYYPGVPSREQAQTVELGEGEWRTDINFKLARSTAP